MADDVRLDGLLKRRGALTFKGPQIQFTPAVLQDLRPEVSANFFLTPDMLFWITQQSMRGWGVEMSW